MRRWVYLCAIHAPDLITPMLKDFEDQTRKENTK